MHAASLIGFAVAFLLSTLVFSLVLGTAVVVAGRALHRAGPRAERCATGVALALSPALGAIVVLVLLGRSLLGPRLGLEDHCLEHGHHLHLCLVHGAEWTSVGWATLTVALAGAWISFGSLRSAVATWRFRRVLGELGKLAQPLPAPGGETIWQVPANGSLCFVAGLTRPRIFVSRAGWEHLDDEQRRAVIAHENAHVVHGDLWRGSILGGASMLGIPFLAARVLDRWRRATERLCDLEAARTVSPEAVATAIVSLVRDARHDRLVAAPTSFFSPEDRVVERLDAVLGDGCDGGATARWIAWGGRAAIASAVALSLALADPLHHVIETLLTLV